MAQRHRISNKCCQSVRPLQLLVLQLAAWRMTVKFGDLKGEDVVHVATFRLSSETWRLPPRLEICTSEFKATLTLKAWVTCFVLTLISSLFVFSPFIFFTFFLSFSKCALWREKLHENLCILGRNKNLLKSTYWLRSIFKQTCNSYKLTELCTSNIISILSLLK